MKNKNGFEYNYIDVNKRYINKDFEMFWGGVFSNFYNLKTPIKYEGKEFTTTEHAFMYGKAKQFKDTEIMKEIVDSFGSSPKVAKKLGRKVKGYDDDEWDKVRYQVMKDVLKEKFSQPKLKGILLGTEDKILVEASPFDAVWGIKMRESDRGVENPNNWRGQNILGQALMEVRDDLRNSK